MKWEVLAGIVHELSSIGSQCMMVKGVWMSEGCPWKPGVCASTLDEESTTCTTYLLYLQTIVPPIKTQALA
jgi:hypothetical protein